MGDRPCRTGLHVRDEVPEQLPDELPDELSASCLRLPDGGSLNAGGRSRTATRRSSPRATGWTTSPSIVPGMNRVPPITRRPVRRATGTAARPTAAVNPATRVTGEGWPVLVGLCPHRTPTSATACRIAWRCRRPLAQTLASAGRPGADTLASGCNHDRFQDSFLLPLASRGSPAHSGVVRTDRTMTASREQASGAHQGGR